MALKLEACKQSIMMLGLFTGVLGAGGIERISRHAASVLRMFARDRGDACILLSLNDPLGDHEVRVGNEVFTIRGFGRRKGRFVFAALRQARLARLVYINHPHLAPIGGTSRVLTRGGPYIVATYGIEVWSSLPAYRRICLERAQTVTTLSRFTAEKLTSVQRVNPRKVAVLPPALDPEFFARDGRLNDSAASGFQKRVLLTVARLAASERYKGIETVFHAMPRVLRTVSDVFYTVVGDGDDRPRLERLAMDLGIANHVNFIGPKFGEDLAECYSACDVFVMPSSGEGFGLVFLEAMAFGKPVIGGNHGGTPDVVVDGVTGFLVEYGDVETLADRLIRLLKEDGLRRQMGEAGRRRVLENFTFEHFRKRLTAVLEGSKPCGS